MQVYRLDVIYRESLPARRRLRQQLTMLEGRLARMLDEGTADEVNARKLIERVCEVEKQRNIARTLMLFRMHQVLSPAQRETLADSGGGEVAAYGRRGF